MSKKKELSCNDVFTKLVNVIKSDVYIVNNSLCVSGVESEERSGPSFICSLSVDAIEAFKISDIFKDRDIVYISDIRKFKAASEEEIQNYYQYDIQDKDSVNEKIETIYHKIQEIDDWKNFDFTNEQLTDLFENKSINLFEDDDNIPTVVIGKSFFPMIKQSNIFDIYYHIENVDNNLITIYIKYDTEYFQINGMIHYINTED